MVHVTSLQTWSQTRIPPNVTVRGENALKPDPQHVRATAAAERAPTVPLVRDAQHLKRPFPKCRCQEDVNYSSSEVYPVVTWAAVVSILPKGDASTSKAKAFVEFEYFRSQDSVK
jgi:hypothetical protein